MNSSLEIGTIASYDDERPTRSAAAGMSGGAKAGIAIGVLIGLAALVFAVILPLAIDWPFSYKSKDDDAKSDPCATRTCTTPSVCSGGKCACPPGKFGDQCQYKDACATTADCPPNSTCESGACVCTALYVKNAAKMCECKAGYWGPTCEYVAKCQRDADCPPNSTCDNEVCQCQAFYEKTESGLCQCKRGWTGPTCRERAPCAANIDCEPSTGVCADTGVCGCVPNSALSGDSCSCKRGWKGDKCETSSCNMDIDCPYKAVCVNNECQCEQYHYWKDGECQVVEV